jgi:N-acyl-D-aspartate/D-glutamate deacylase
VVSTSRSVVLRNGLIVDGTGAPGFVADLAIRDGRVAEVGAVSTPGDLELDARGLVVSPGFIDVHTHLDALVCWDPWVGAIGQYGITTAVIGNCGIGVAPLRDGGGEYLIQLLARVEGMPVGALEQGISWDWHSYADYLDVIDRPLATNIVALVGHCPLRYLAMGDRSYQEAARPDDLAVMQDELRSALRAGAWGFSSTFGVTHNDLAGRPAPSRLADLAEFEALADVLGEFPFGMVGISPESKLRGLSEDDQSLMQMLSVRGGAAVNWNPLAHTPSMPDLWERNLVATERCSSGDARVYGVFNPASNGGSRVDLQTLFLFAGLPNWRPLAQLSIPDRIAAFSDPRIRERLARDIAEDTSMGLLSAVLRSMWDILRVTVVYSAANERFVGRCVGEIARETGRTPLETMLDIAIADDLRTVFMQEDVRRRDEVSRAAFASLSTSPNVLYGGSDAGAHLDMLANDSLPLRAMQWRVAEERSVTLEEMVRRFSSAIADASGLLDRGRLVPGAAGDVFVFELDAVGAGDAFLVGDLPGGGERLTTRAQGVRYTIVNGVVVYENGEATGDLPGRVLRSGDR